MELADFTQFLQTGILLYFHRRMVSQIIALAIKKLDNFTKSPVVFQIKLEFTKKI